jgi:hypothetical protein
MVSLRFSGWAKMRYLRARVILPPPNDASTTFPPAGPPHCRPAAAAPPPSPAPRTRTHLRFPLLPIPEPLRPSPRRLICLLRPSFAHLTAPAPPLARAPRLPPVPTGLRRALQRWATRALALSRLERPHPRPLPSALPLPPPLRHRVPRPPHLPVPAQGLLPH